MFFERIFSKGLAHNSYILGSGGTAAVIDPRRDCDIYLEIAARNTCTITHIFETHRNEDYVSGAPELAYRCGAEICHGAAMDFLFGTPVKDGDLLTFGSITLQVLETPGHTEEGITLVLRDRQSGETPLMAFCGDTVFAGDIARTDFFGDERKEEMAEKIYDSIMNRIFSLGDGLILCPAHGAGSVCGSAIADRPFTTTGYEKSTNALIRNGREAFISRRKTESPYKPPYFRTMERYNREGAPLLHHVPVLRPLTVAAVNRLRKTGCQILDIRGPTAFGCGHIPGSISLWREGISSYAGWYLNYEEPCVIIDDFNLDIEAVQRQFLRMGYDNLAGFLDGGFMTWCREGQEIGTTGTCSVHELKEQLDHGTPFLLDVRDIRNRRAFGYIPHSHHIYAGELPGHIREIPADEPVYIYCDAGFKGSLAASILSRYHFRTVINVLGGFNAWKQAGFRVGH